MHNDPTMAPKADPADIRPVPAESLDAGFRLLTLREFRSENEPSGFAWIDQQIFRTPLRPSRHGVSFGHAFLPEIMAWLSERLGRPSLRAGDGGVFHNPRWPVMSWHREDRLWPGGIRTIEWSVAVTFLNETLWDMFREYWYDRLTSAPDVSDLPDHAAQEIERD